MDLNASIKFVKDRGVMMPNGQVMLTEPLYVFKKVYADSYDAVANLVVPIGAVVNLADGSSRKFRTNQAYCFSIAKVSSRKEVAVAYSSWDSYFKYRSGKHLGLTLNDIQNLVHDAEKYVKGGEHSRNLEAQNKKKILEAAKCIPSNFFTGTAVCAQGIHFFLELDLAKSYY